MRHPIPLLVAALAMGACGTDEDGGSGSLVLTVSGEEAAVTGFPVPGQPELQFADGWSVRFDKYLVGLGNIRVAGADGETALVDDRKVVVDLTRGEQRIFRFDDLPARRWERFGYDILAPTSETLVVGSIAGPDVTRMVANRFNYWIEGTATRGDEILTFAWGITAPTHNDDCVNGVDDSPGVVIRNNATATYQITLHLDHLFYDRLGDHEGVSMRFEAIAAVAKDGVIAWEDLATQRLASLVDTAGQPLRDEAGELLVYDPGSIHLEERDLLHYLEAASISQGRFNGEGTCVNRSIE